MRSAHKQVLFICTGNYYRSRFAEILFNHLATEADLHWRADSCGLNIAVLGPEHPGHLSRWAQEGLALRKILPPGPYRPPRQASEADFEAADLVIALKEAEHRPMLEKLHPTRAGSVQYWHIHDVDQASPETALPELEQLVRRLVNELKN
ncbi:MAG: low molecular weight phosphatase family protein [Phycisphaerales bacterium]|nr:low molecular weight phosphatase family protein [Phycisphaerales bacterium]